MMHGQQHPFNHRRSIQTPSASGRAQLYGAGSTGAGQAGRTDDRLDLAAPVIREGLPEAAQTVCQTKFCSQPPALSHVLKNFRRDTPCPVDPGEKFAVNRQARLMLASFPERHGQGRDDAGSFKYHRFNVLEAYVRRAAKPAPISKIFTVRLLTQPGRLTISRPSLAVHSGEC